MKVSALQVLHYGLDYVFWSLSSVHDQVDEIVICYTPHPSHGHRTSIPCPETEEELKDIAMSVGPKVRWHRVDRFWEEGQHRDYALSLCSGDLALVVDCDEVWHAPVLEQVLKTAYDGDVRDWLVNFTTPWRSFNWVCRDNLWPVRVIDLRRREGTAYVPKELGDVFHFGYCVRDHVMRYKSAVHGHKSQWRPDWYEEKWNAWPPVPDCHPTDVGIWHPELFDKMELPKLLRGHHFWDLEVVK